MNMRVNEKIPTAVVCDLYITGLSALRDFAKNGIPVIGIDFHPRRIGFVSRYGQKFLCPEVQQEEELLEFFLNLGKTLSRGGVLFPTSDEFVLFISKYRSTLAKYFKFVLPKHRFLKKITSKIGQYEIAIEAGFSVPETYFLKNPWDVVRSAHRLGYPCIIKPELAQSWRTPEIQSITGGSKVVKVNSDRELSYMYEQLSKTDSKLILQEIIPGSDDQLFYVVSYLDKNSVPLGIFAGRKLRTMPIHFGSGSCVESFYDREMIEMCIEFLRSFNYQGLSGIEIKKDPRDNRYKLIEINPRFGLWDILGVRFGVDFPLMAYRDAIGEQAKAVDYYPTGVKWISIENDLRAFIHYRREGSLRFKSWISSLKGEKEWAVLSWNDPIPGLWIVYRMLSVASQHLLRFFRK